MRRCANDCAFCFVDQLPPGLRPSLSVRDDDYRLSFLQGTFVTLTNVDDHDLERIAALRLSPLYVSLHAWDDDVRARLMGRRRRGARERLVWLAAGGIESARAGGAVPGRQRRRRAARDGGAARRPGDAPETLGSRRPPVAGAGARAASSTWASCPCRSRGAAACGA